MRDFSRILDKTGPCCELKKPVVRLKATDMGMPIFLKNGDKLARFLSGKSMISDFFSNRFILKQSFKYLIWNWNKLAFVEVLERKVYRVFDLEFSGLQLEVVPIEVGALSQNPNRIGNPADEGERAIFQAVEKGVDELVFGWEKGSFADFTQAMREAC